MPLTLTIVGDAALDPDTPRSHTWHERGGTLGRAPNNDWTLPDPEQSISRCHARIRYQHGAYFLEDTSTNGIFLGTLATRLDAAALYRLGDGDELLIGAYRILVRIDSESLLSPAPASPPILPVNEGEISSDPLALLGGEVQSTPDPLEAVARHESYLNEHLDLPPMGGPQPEIPPSPATPAPGGASALLPDDWWKQPAQPGPAPSPDTPDPGSGRAEAAPPVTDPPSAPSASPIPPQPAPPAFGSVPGPSPSADLPRGILRDLLAGAGLHPDQLPPDLSDDLGRILRVAVEGVMDLMRARMEIKNEFRMSVTMIQAHDNNPLKFSTSVEDALHNLLVKRNPSYLSAVKAFESSFEDLRFHQVALLAGMREAFFEMLQQLDPTTLEARFNEQAGTGSMLGRVARPRPWEQYKGLFAEIRGDTEGYFNRLFGEAFVAAYERRMKELKDSAAGRDTN